MSRHTWVAAALGAAVVATLTAAPAQAAPPPAPVDCPTALPTADAVDGLTGTGWTVERGSTPDTFTATVLGRITDGIAPGVDMIMADLDSPALQRAGGVWAGMSGSPVYTDGGQLIGSVSYGLSASSPIAGITPAESLQTLLSADPDDVTARSPRRVAVAPKVAQRLARTGEVTATAAAQGFSRLRTPIVVNGATGQSAQKLADRLSKRAGVPVVLAGTSGPSAQAAPALAGGDNFAVAAAYGDATLGGVGTTTFTCSGEAVAFGHPFMDAGVTTYSAHSADAVYVQPDPVNGPFKVANFGPVIGTVDRDRTLGLRAELGAGPATVPVVSRLTRVESGVTRTGTTQIAEADLSGDAAAFHTVYNVDRVMGSAASKGTAKVTLTVSGRVASGKVFSVAVRNTFTALSSVDALDFQVADWVYSTVASITDQPFEQVSLTGVRLDGTVSSAATTWRSPVVEVKKAGKWVRLTSGGLRSQVGAWVSTRTTLSKYRDAATKTSVVTSLKVPASARYKDVVLVMSAGGFMEDQSEPGSFVGLLRALSAQPRNDTVEASLVDAESGDVLVTRSVTTSAVVEPFVKAYDVYLL
ncbi:SpoIVB peptidase S55 domain-containing protein [Angustibacter peucedani]